MVHLKCGNSLKAHISAYENCINAISRTIKKRCTAGVKFTLETLLCIYIHLWIAAEGKCLFTDDHFATFKLYERTIKITNEIGN